MQAYERGMQFEYIPADVIEKTRKLEMIQRKMERDIRMEKEKTALYMIVYKQSGNESVHKQEIAFRKNATAMRKQLESFCRANGLVYYPDRIKIMEGEDIYLRTKGKNDKIALSAKNIKDTNYATEVNLPQKLLTSSSKSAIMQMDNVKVREWYLDKVSKIPDEIDPTLPIEDRAKQAFEARNRIRTEARNMMIDQETRQKLDKERPNKTFEELVESKMKRKGMTREEAIQDVYNTATKTNANVNKELGLGGE